MSATEMLVERKANKNYVPPISMYTLGRRAFSQRLDLSDCITDEMRRGWNDAFDAAFDGEYAAGGLDSATAFAQAVVQ